MLVGIQSPIPLIYLLPLSGHQDHCWDSVTYPLDILGRAALLRGDLLGFSHLSP